LARKFPETNTGLTFRATPLHALCTVGIRLYVAAPSS
jgi:hypothetical protein